MRALLFAAFAFLTFSSLHAIDVSINDTLQMYYLKSTLGFNVTVKREGSTETDFVQIKNARAILLSREVRNTSETSVFFNYNIVQSTPTFIKAVHLTLEAQRSADNVRRYIREFELSLVFDASTGVGNWSDTTLTFVVRPPKFPHFQVKSDWQFECPKNLSLLLCHVGNGSVACSTEKPYSLLEVRMLLSDIVFHGGKEYGHDYSSKIEECPLAYETRQDIGIACIVAFWSIALAFAIWGVVKFLIKRHRKRTD